MDKKKALIVDDEPDILDSMRFHLEQEGYEVFTASNGWEALGAVRATQPDIVVLDVMMPKENGYRVSKMIKEDIASDKITKNIPIIILTARRLDNDLEREGMFDEFSQADMILYKPFDLDELAVKVQGLLGKAGVPS